MSGNNSSEDREEWLERMKKEGKLPEDKKEDHRGMSRALENPTRRDILKYIGTHGGWCLFDVDMLSIFLKP